MTIVASRGAQRTPRFAGAVSVVGRIVLMLGTVGAWAVLIQRPVAAFVARSASGPPTIIDGMIVLGLYGVPFLVLAHRRARRWVLGPPPRDAQIAVELAAFRELVAAPDWSPSQVGSVRRSTLLVAAAFALAAGSTATSWPLVAALVWLTSARLALAASSGYAAAAVGPVVEIADEPLPDTLLDWTATVQAVPGGGGFARRMEFSIRGTLLGRDVAAVSNSGASGAARVARVTGAAGWRLQVDRRRDPVPTAPDADSRTG